MNFNDVQNFLANLVKRQTRIFFPKGVSDYTTVEELLEKLMSSSGEISAMVTAREILNRYKKLDNAEQLKFFQHLEQNFNADVNVVRIAFREYDQQPDSGTLRTLSDATEPRRQELLRRLNQTAGATHDLVAMREDLLKLLKQNDALSAVDNDFIHLFASWFARGFLILQTIDWSTSASILERIIRYESVHEIQDWNELRRRIEPDNRRCFAFFHPALIDEPLIFVEVALCHSIPESIAEILKEEDPDSSESDYDTAAFYSISNCQPGLKNVSFGNFLIKQVVQELQSEFPSIKKFVTLSPIPKLCRWLDDETRSELDQLSLEIDLIKQLPNDIENAAAKPVELTKVTAEYLLNAKRGIHPIDPVARFHLGNGAQVHQIRIAADTSDKGLKQSRGVMVNYLYDLRYLERNHEQFMTAGKIDCNPEILKLLQKQ